MVPRVFAPVAPVAEVDGVTVVLLTVEWWGDRVAVRLICPPNAVTRDRDAWAEEQLRAWMNEYRAGRRPDHPPPDAAEATYRALTVSVEEHRAVARHVGGTGTEWLSEWFFEPAGRPDPGMLTVHIAVRDGGTSTHRFSIAG